MPVERLRGRRRTVARTTKDGPLKMFMDDWRNAEKTEKAFESRWAGRTIFQLEGPEEEEPQEEEKEEGDLHDPAAPCRRDLGLRAGGVGRRTGRWRDGRRRPGRV